MLTITQAEHKAMNSFLNETTKESRQPGRISIAYEHPKQTDSFRVLSLAGLQALPPSVQRRKLPSTHDLKLRTTTDTATGRVLARIVKIPIAHLHIFNPLFDYDLRISINLEANLNLPDLHPDDLVQEATSDNLLPPDRQKDRMSYKHLAYSIDLTRVDVKGIAAKYELEVEVDANVLREQMRLLGAGQRHAYTEVVSGFLDNCTLLMRQRAAA